ncbi:MAG: zinc-dependent metalloprotease [Acidimicrobiia bacterium]|nr:zinc-dependent metalloprotease [Acidimicrobiia bacterium]MDX2467391.1 zinc-dependent metalloprotease [Acidimicrobiia bacterium]
MSTTTWSSAVSIARRFAGNYPLEGTYHEARLARQAPLLVERATALVAEETGLEAPGTPDVAVVSRAEWVENNIASFSELMAPVTERLGEQKTVGRGAAGRLMSAELGALLGFLSRRVLGQYELVLPTSDGRAGDTVMFVGANVLAIERRFEFRPAEFRFWVALHESTHRLQFQGVPWLRSYFLGLVEELVNASKPEPGRMARLAEEVREASAQGRPLVTEQGLFGLLATPDQREVIDKVQALMSLLEGHGHVVMDRIGARELVSQERMSRILASRRNDPRTAMFMRLVGLEMKMKQYDMGAKFIDGVERQAGWSALDAAWLRPSNLPTLEEIEDPVSWLYRVG